MSKMTAPASVCSRSHDVRCPSGCRIILSGNATCKQADPARRVERVDAGLPRRALLEQRALGRVLDPAGGVIADLLDRMLERPRPEGEVIGRHHVVGHAGRRIGRPAGRRRPAAADPRERRNRPRAASTSQASKSSWPPLLSNSLRRRRSTSFERRSSSNMLQDRQTGRDTPDSGIVGVPSSRSLRRVACA